MKLKIVVMPDGKSILTTGETLDPSTFEKLREAFGQWSKTERGSLVLAETEVVRVEEIELDIS